MTEFFLTALANYGPLALGLAAFVAAAGLPTPSTPLIAAAGGLARQGLVDLPLALAFGLVGAVLGDCTCYALGRFAGDWVERHLKRFQAGTWGRAQDWFKRYGGGAIFLTRFLFVSLDVPTSLIAGGSHYDFRRFLFWVVTGRSAWIAFYAGLGYLFGSQWSVISEFVVRNSVWVALIAIAIIGIWYLIRRQRRTGNLQPATDATIDDPPD